MVVTASVVASAAGGELPIDLVGWGVLAVSLVVTLAWIVFVFR